MARMLASVMVAAVTLLSLASASVQSGAARGEDWSSPDVSLWVTLPSEPFLHHVNVTVSWEFKFGEFDPQQDWLSSWWEPFPQAYVQYFNVSGNTGSATFSLLNARHPYSFRFYRGDSMLTEAYEKISPDATYPMGVRTLLLGSPENEMSVMWTSNRSLGENTAVRFGYAADNLQYTTAASSSLTYTAEELNTRLELPPIARRTTAFDNIGSRDIRCGFGTCYNDFTANELWVEPGLHHVATLTDLAPNTVYYYQVGELNGHMSAIRKFRTKATPSPNSSISVLYVADAGAGYQTGSHSGSATHNASPIPGAGEVDGGNYVWAAIKNDKQIGMDTCSIMNGDVSYARGWPYIWELFHNETEDVFGELPVMLSFGNHEFDYGHNPFKYCNGGDSGGEAGVSTGRRYNQNYDKPWYFVANGPAFFILLSSEHDPVEQAEWIRNEAFPAFDRRVTPWLIVMQHRPLYESSPYDESYHYQLMRAQFVNLFVEMGVDLVLTGHSHYYERMCQISSGTCNTWGFRDVWTQYVDASIDESKSGDCFLQDDATSQFECQAHCAQSQGVNATKKGDCTGMMWDDYRSNCTLVTCAQPFPLTYTGWQTSVWNMEKQPGVAPVYIVDGTAGGTFTNNNTPSSPLTVYKDFMHWGYSRIGINGTTLTWHHHHIDNSIVDEFVLTK